MDTCVYVKLLLPPRQSRGISCWIKMALWSVFTASTVSRDTPTIHTAGDDFVTEDGEL